MKKEMKQFSGSKVKRLISWMLCMTLVLGLCTSNCTAVSAANAVYEGQYSVKEILSRFQVFLKGDYIGDTSAHTMGAVAVGGILQLDNSVGDVGIVPSYVNHLEKGYVGTGTFYVDNEKFENNVLYYNTKEENVSDNKLVHNPDYMDMKEAFSVLESASANLATEGTVVAEKECENGVITVDFTKEKKVIIPAQLLQKYDINMLVPEEECVNYFKENTCVISITGDCKELNFNEHIFINGIAADNQLKEEMSSSRTQDNQINLDGMNLVWNVPDATELTIANLTGHLVAPKAAVNAISGNYEGGIIAASLTSCAQGHFYCYDGEELGTVTTEITVEDATSEDSITTENVNVEVTTEVVDGEDQTTETAGETGKTTENVGETGKSTETAGETSKTTEKVGETGKTTEIAGETGKTTETAGETGKTTETAGETGKTTEIAGETGKTTEKASETGKTTETAGETSKTTETAGETSKTTETAGETSKTTEKAGETSKTTETAGETSKTTETASETSKTTEKAGETSKTTETAGETSKTTETVGETSKTTEKAGETSKTTEKAGETSKTTEKAGETSKTTETASESDKTTADITTEFINEEIISVTKRLAKVTVPNPAEEKVHKGTTYQTTLTPETGYKMYSISVVIGNETYYIAVKDGVVCDSHQVITDAITYQPETGELVITDRMVTENIVIVAVAQKKEQEEKTITVTKELEGVTISNPAAEVIKAGSNYFTVLTPDADKKMTMVKVTIGTAEYTIDLQTGKVYDENGLEYAGIAYVRLTGNLIISPTATTEDIVIYAKAEKAEQMPDEEETAAIIKDCEHVISSDGYDPIKIPAFTQYEVTLTPEQDYQLTNFDVLVNNTRYVVDVTNGNVSDKTGAYVDNISYDVDNGSLVVSKTVTEGNIYIIVKAEKTSVTEQVVTTENVDKTAENPTTEQADKTTENPTTEQADKTTENPTTEQTDKTTENPTTEQANKTTVAPATEQANKTTAAPAAERANKTTAAPTTEQVNKTTVAPATEQANKTTAAPATERANKTTAAPATEQADKTTAAPATEQANKTTAAPATEQANKTTAAPATEQANKTTENPTTEQANKTTTVPATEQANTTNQNPTTQTSPAEKNITVTKKLENVTVQKETQNPAKLQEYTIVAVPNKDTELNEVSVKIGSNLYTIDVETGIAKDKNNIPVAITFDPTSGRLHIPANMVTDNMVIVVKAVVSKVPILKMNKTIAVKTKFKINLVGISSKAQVSYRSSNKKIAAINKKGIITGKKLGKCKIYADVIQNGSYYRVKINLTVRNKVIIYSLKKPALSKRSGKLPEFNVYKRVFKGKKTKVKFFHVAKKAKVTYTSSNPKVATVKKSGKIGIISGKKQGFTVVTAKIVQNNKTYITRLFVRVDDYKENKNLPIYLKELSK